MAAPWTRSQRVISRRKADPVTRLGKETRRYAQPTGKRVCEGEPECKKPGKIALGCACRSGRYVAANGCPCAAGLPQPLYIPTRGYARLLGDHPHGGVSNGKFEG